MSYKHTLSYELFSKKDREEEENEKRKKLDADFDIAILMEDIAKFSDLIKNEGDALLKELAHLDSAPHKTIKEFVEKASGHVLIGAKGSVDRDIEEYRKTDGNIKELESTMHEIKIEREATKRFLSLESDDDESLMELDAFIKNMEKEKDDLAKLKLSLKERLLKTRDSIKLIALKTVDLSKVLDKDMRLTSEKKLLDYILKEEKEAKSLDLCIMIDCTFSMQEHINMARNKIKEIVNQVKKQFSEAELRVGVVGYRDVFEAKRFEILAFTKDIQKVTDFLEGIEADGGQDGPEDVNGGFQETLKKMDWKAFNRTILHIADAPCHGVEFHDMEEVEDFYPEGFPEDMRWEVVFKKMKEKKVNYLFLKIKKATDIMFEKFQKIWKDVELKDKGMALSFEQEVIEKDVKKFTEVTIEHLTKSISTGIKETLKVLKDTELATKTDKKPMLLMIGEEDEDDDDEPRHFGKKIEEILETKIEEQDPEWEASWFLSKKFNGISHYITQSISDFKIKGGCQAFAKEKVEIKLNPTPFSKGNFSIAYYCKAKPQISTQYFNMVLKKSIEPADKHFYFSVLDKNTIAASLAKEYNEQLAKKKVHVDERIYFTRVLVVNIKGQYYLLEAYIPGDFRKYTNNYTYVNESVPLLTAFSHFTYHATEGKYMVADLQGVDNLLTDPVVHSFDRHFKNQGDLGQPGMLGFFRYHECNKYCEMLGLPVHEAQKNKSDHINRDPVEFNIYRMFKKCNYYFCNNNSRKNPLCNSCQTNVDFTKNW